MMTQSTLRQPDQKILELFEFTTAKKPECARLRRRIKEVISGRRPSLRIYSSRLRSAFWLVNEGLEDPTAAIFAGKAITMRQLAELMLDQENSTQILLEILSRTSC